MTKFLCAVVALMALMVLSACAGTFEEAKVAGIKARAATPAVAASTPERCQSLSNAARIEGAIAKGGAVLTGASGISAWPVEGDARAALAITSGVLAAGTATVFYLYETDAAAYIAEGCPAK